MKRVIFVLTVLLIAGTTVDAQNRRRTPRKQVDKTERIEMRAQRMTDAMVTTYNLSEDQKNQLMELNKKWFTKDRDTRFDRNDVRKQNRSKACLISDSTCLATPTIYREVRVKALEADIISYRTELKKILTSKQYKEYEKRVEEGIKKALGK